ncbi:MAG TPA: hypothetical protein PLE99_10125 [Candidatus Thiothrix moscowensis]|uniref:hypothetical protein n=1 Tax=Thiothrix sp. UBA2016 TaxID=1947695 RepID=UPI0025CC7233|nr:hypothetical protein [Thiothrix sp. UBA2016]HRJ53116.1 hypothetical protein [Candidatus Thiothrix moscowensis]HRJ93107.1 hypothetical protein [Candidatus Thiothrix moscowensis]
MEIESFLKKNDLLMPISNYKESIQDDFYIEGAIEITTDSGKVLTRDTWDYVDQLWNYFIEGISELLKGNSYSTYFPDQPIKISFIPSGNSKVLIKVEKKMSSIAVSVDRHEFIQKTLVAGSFFFEHLTKLAPRLAGACKKMLMDIDEMQNQL